MTDEKRERWIKFTILGVIIHLLSYPVLMFVGFHGAMASFTHDTKRTTRYWEPEPPGIGAMVWMGGYLVSSWAVDRVIFGSPMPPAPTNPDFSEPGAREKLQRMSELWKPEYERRKWAHGLCWVFNELLFGVIFGRVLMWILEFY